MSILARFQDRALFPSFDDLSTTNPQPAKENDASGKEGERRLLVGQIAENMTITQPTLILRDRDSSSFAITFEGSVDLKGWRKGYTLVVEGAQRTEGKEGKRGFVVVPEGEEGAVRCVPGPMDKVIVMGAAMGSENGECRGCGGGGGGCAWGAGG